MKQNCWEFKKCGREPGGAKVHELGICPAATNTTLYGENDGRYAGRCCWLVAGTMCGGQIQGTFSKKLRDCAKCDFYRLVRDGESNSPDSNIETNERTQPPSSDIDL